MKLLKISAFALLSLSALTALHWLQPAPHAAKPVAEAEERESDLDSPDQAMLWRRKAWVDENGKIPANALQRAIAQKEALVASTPRPRVAGDYWVEAGPDNTSGRSRCLIINPINPLIMYQGTAGGGVWKTTDGGTTWLPISNNFGSLAVGALAFDPADPNTIYAGTGEGWFNFNSLVGAGIYKSNDAGATWTLLPNTTGFGAVNRLVLSPVNRNLILTATKYGGIRRSTDAGNTWTTVLSAQVGQSVAFSTGNPNLVIAGLLDYDSTTSQWYTVTAYSSDAGATWTRSANRTNLVSSRASIEITWAGNSSTTAFSSGPSSSSSSTVVVSKSVDGGVTWTPTTATIAGSGQNWYDNCIWVDPTNPNLILVGDTRIWRSTTGGASWTSINANGYTQTTMPHPDIHGITQSPGYDGAGNKKVYFVTDGGCYVANDITLVTGTSSSNWTRLDRNCHTTQYYYVAGDGGTGRIIGGLQDNGALMMPTGSGQSVWTFGGDGGASAIDYQNPNYVYGEYVYLQMERATGGGTTQNSGGSMTSGLSDAGSSICNFISPFTMDPNNPQTILGGGASLWRCVNARATTPTWAAIKPAVSGDPIASIAIAKGNSDIIWVGHNSGRLYMTTNGTAASPTWVAIDDNSATSPLPNRYLRSILIDPQTPTTVYVTLGGFTSGNVWKTTTAGASWTDISGNLPQSPVHTIARHTTAPNTLYVGTEVGLFSTTDGGAHWTVPSDMGANCPVFDLQYMNNSATLIAATHGRGIWKLQSQSMSGHVTLGQYTGDVTLPQIDISILDGAGATLQTVSTRLDAAGNFVVNTAVTPGTYTVRIKGSTRFLSKLVPNVSFSLAGAFSVSATLLNGDVNGDNAVSLGDFGLLRAAYGSVPGDTNWNPLADLDGNGSVSLGDFSILRGNYGLSGE